LDSHPLGPWKATAIPVIDFHELAAGKIVALFSWGQARDLFDCHQIFYKCDPDYQKLRLAFVVYGAMNRKDWRTVSLNEVNFNAAAAEIGDINFPGSKLHRLEPKKNNIWAVKVSGAWRITFRVDL
jgi:plasmid maintenance system killer protein